MSGGFLWPTDCTQTPATFCISDYICIYAGKLFSTSVPWAAHRLDIKIFPDCVSPRHTVIIKLKSFKIWLGEGNKWLLHKIHTSPHIQYTYADMSGPLYRYTYIYSHIYTYIHSNIPIVNFQGGACGVMVTVVGNGHGDTSSNPGRD